MNRRDLLLASFAGLASRAFGAQLPRLAPPLKFISHLGQQIDLANYKGKVVLLEWLMTTCPHCQVSSQILSKLQTEYAARGVQALGVAIDAGAGQKLPDYVRKYATTFPVGVLPHQVATGWLQASVMAPLMMPQLVIIDRQGQIREQYAGDDKWHEQAEKNLRAAIAKYAAQGAGAAAKRPAKKK
jgi:peroxiredoxin